MKIDIYKAAYLCLLMMLFCFSNIQAQFASPLIVDSTISADGLFYGEIATADLDGDGDGDIVVTTEHFGFSFLDQVLWFENLGGLSYGPPQALDSLQLLPGEVEIADMDQDGDPDVVCALFNDYRIAWYENVSPGVIGPKHIAASSIVLPRSIEIADMDGDGDPDIVTNDYGNLVWVENLGSANFAPLITLATNSALVSDIRVSDLDNDGDIDIVATNRSNSKVYWIENFGGGSFSGEQILTSTTQSERIAIGDFNNDGYDDVACIVNFWQEVLWFENFGIGLFGPEQVISDGLLYPDDIEVADVNGDNFDDVIVSASNRVVWYPSNGSTFGPEVLISDEFSSYDFAFAGDLDDDCDIDVITTGFLPSATHLAVHENLIDSLNCECDPAVAPDNLQSQIIGSQILLSWDPIPYSVGCQLQAHRVSPPGPSPIINIPGDEVSSISAPLSALGAGTIWSWETRCACSISPSLSVTPFSASAAFVIPAPREAEDKEEQDKRLRVFPNPAHSMATIVAVAGIETITVRSIGGEPISHNTVKDEKFRLDVTDYPSGLYTLEIEYYDGERELRKLMVQH